MQTANIHISQWNYFICQGPLLYISRFYSIQGFYKQTAKALITLPSLIRALAVRKSPKSTFSYPPNCVCGRMRGILFSCCPSICPSTSPSIRPSIMFLFMNSGYLITTAYWHFFFKWPSSVYWHRMQAIIRQRNWALNFHFLMIQLISSFSSPVVDVGPLLEQQQFRRLDNMKAHCFAVSGSRHTATVVSYKNTHHKNMPI